MDQITEVETAQNDALGRRNLPVIAQILSTLSVREIIRIVDRTELQRAAVVFRLLGKDRALAVFASVNPVDQSDLIVARSHQEVTQIFGELDLDDRVGLLDELPTTVAQRLMATLSPTNGR